MGHVRLLLYPIFGQAVLVAPILRVLSSSDVTGVSYKVEL